MSTEPEPILGTIQPTDTFGRTRKPKRGQLTHVRIGNRPLCGLHKPARRWSLLPTQSRPNCARCHEIAVRRQDPKVLALWAEGAGGERGAEGAEGAEGAGGTGGESG